MTEQEQIAQLVNSIAMKDLTNFLFNLPDDTPTIIYRYGLAVGKMDKYEIAIRAAIKKLDRPGMQHTVREAIAILQKGLDDDSSN